MTRKDSLFYVSLVFLLRQKEHKFSAREGGRISGTFGLTILTVTFLSVFRYRHLLGDFHSLSLTRSTRGNILASYSSAFIGCTCVPKPIFDIFFHCNIRRCCTDP